MIVIDKLAPFKTKRVKSNWQEWFKSSKLNVDKEIYKVPNKIAQNDFAKKKRVSQNKLEEKIAKARNLQKKLKLIGLSKNFSVDQTNAIEDNKHLKCDLKSAAQTFAKFYLI